MKLEEVSVIGAGILPIGGGAIRWVHEPRLPELDPHGLHRTFATWLEDGDVPLRPEATRRRLALLWWWS